MSAVVRAAPEDGAHSSVGRFPALAPRCPMGGVPSALPQRPAACAVLCAGTPLECTIFHPALSASVFAASESATQLLRRARLVWPNTMGMNCMVVRSTATSRTMMPSPEAAAYFCQKERVCGDRVAACLQIKVLAAPLDLPDEQCDEDREALPSLLTCCVASPLSEASRLVVRDAVGEATHDLPVFDQEVGVGPRGWRPSASVPCGRTSPITTGG